MVTRPAELTGSSAVFQRHGEEYGMAEVNAANIQGIILRGYGKFDISCFVLLKVVAASQARKWLGRVAPTVNTARRGGDYDRTEKPRPVMNVAFTFDGLVSLGLHEANMRGFSKEFREGMCTSHRQRLLGDFDQSDPIRWRWGGPNNEPVHIMLCLYATDQAGMELFYRSLTREFPLAGLEVIDRLDGLTLEGRREHFGFRDGIAQPGVNGYSDDNPGSPSRANRVSPGEFLLGYPNEYGVYPDSPVVIQPQGTPEVLGATVSDGADLGRDGSYLVFRQLSQDVKAFWEFLDAKTRNSDGSSDGVARTALASRMVGRWPSGAPLVATRTPIPAGSPMKTTSDTGKRIHTATNARSVPTSDGPIPVTDSRTPAPHGQRRSQTITGSSGAAVRTGGCFRARWVPTTSSQPRPHRQRSACYSCASTRALRTSSNLCRQTGLRRRSSKSCTTTLTR